MSSRVSLRHTLPAVRLAAATGMMLLACRPADTGNRSGNRPTAKGQVVKTFPAEGVSRVVFRAAEAREARITSAQGNTITVSGTPRGGAPGYHPSDPKWKETPASEWGLDFREKAFGKALVISTFNEIHYIHHSYYLDDLVISVPKGVEVTLEARELSGEGAPDLKEPKTQSPQAGPSR